MATLEEVRAAIARKQAQQQAVPTLDEVRAAIARRQAEQQAMQQAPVMQPQQAEQQPPMQSASPRGTRAARLRQQRELEREQFLSSLNPYQRELIESTSPAEAALIAAGKGFRDIGVGIGVADAPSEFDKQTMQRLETAYPTAVPLGEFAGQAAPFVVPGLGAAAIPSQAGRVAAMTGLGAAEGAILARAEGRSLGEQLFAAGIGGTVAGALELALPHFGRLGGQFIRRATGQRATQAAFDSAGNPSDELIDALAREDKTLDEFINEEIEKETKRNYASPSDVIEEETTRTEIKFDLADTAATREELEETIGILRKGESKKSAKQAAEEAGVDPEIIASAERLGIHIPTSSASTNRAFVEAAQAAKSQPGSMLSLQEANAILQAKDKAAELIKDLRGGEQDVSIFDYALEREFTDSIESLANASSDAYKIVERVIPDNMEIQLNKVRTYIDGLLEKHAGDESMLKGPQKKLLYLLKKEDQGKINTYATLDEVRKDIGSGFNRKGDWKDVDDVHLSGAYAAISDDQQFIVDDVSEVAGRAYAEGRKLVAERKDLEQVAKNVFGAALKKSVLPSLKKSATDLINGNQKTFNALMKDIPENYREEAAALVLEMVFSAGSRTKEGLSESFSEAFKKLNKNKGARDAIFKHLPQEAVKTYTDIGRVWNALIRSKALENTSKSARDVLAALQGDTAARKLATFGARVATGDSLAVASMVYETVKRKKKTAVQKIDDLVTSERFADAVKAYAAAPAEAAKKADDKLRKTKKYKEWAKYLPDADRKRIEEIGFVPYLIEPVQKTAPVIGAAAAQQPEQE
jgi:hypothetical protein